MTLPTFRVRVEENVINPLPPYSDKAILPENILQEIIDIIPNNKLPHPLIFRIYDDDDDETDGKDGGDSVGAGYNIGNNDEIYISVKEFSSPQHDLIILPNCIRKKLKLNNVRLELVESLPKPVSLNLQPKHNYNILNWKYFLEYTLTKFYTTLTTGDTLIIENENLRYELDIVEIDGSKSKKTVCIIDSDIVLDIPSNEITSLKTEEIFLNQQLLIDIPSFKLFFNPTVYKIDLNKLDLPVFKLKLSLDNIIASDLIIGFDKFLNFENFTYSTMNELYQTQLDQGIKTITINRDEVGYYNKVDQSDDGNGGDDDDEIDDKWLYVIAFSWDDNMTGKLTVEPNNTLLSKMTHESDQTISEVENGLKCSNCLKFISPNQFQLHEAFCKRNNIKCSKCDTVFLHEIPSTHWHCPTCLFWTNLELGKFKHNKLFHESKYSCICGANFDNHFDLANHKSSICPNKLHICRFCHMIVPQGQSTYIDKFENLSNHENQCGNKTTGCYKCNKIFRLKDIKKHLMLHDLETRQFNQNLQINFQKCHNENCINELSSNANDLSLCELCYGPLYIQDYDPSNLKLQQRIERKYMLQLTKGCGNDWCNNEYCLTNSSTLKMRTFKEKLQILNQSLFLNIKFPSLPINKSKQVSSINKFWFCVNESVLKRKVIYELIACEKEYPSEIILKAVNNFTDELGARTWLNNNGVKVQ